MLPELPKVLAVDDDDLDQLRIKVIQEAGVDADAAGAAIPFPIGLEGRTVAERGAAAMDAEVVRHQFCLPAVDRVVGRQHCRMKLVRLTVGQQRPSFGAERTRAACELSGHLCIDTKLRLAAVAASGDGHVSKTSAASLNRRLSWLAATWRLLGQAAMALSHCRDGRLI